MCKLLVDEREREREMKFLCHFILHPVNVGCKGILVNNCDCLQGYGQADNLTSIIQLFVALNKPQN